jgi:hypothetical protein
MALALGRKAEQIKENMMKVLTLNTDSFDNFNVFKLAGVRGKIALHKDYKVAGDGIYWGLQHSAILKSHYTEYDDMCIKNFEAMTEITNGEIVMIENEEYITRINGNYSDACVFEKIV